MSRTVASLAALAALALAGCSDPYARPASESPPREARPAPSETPVGDAWPVPTVAPAPTEDERAGSARSAEALARAYAKRAISWDWRTVQRQLAALRALAAAPLSDELARTAELLRRDGSLERERPGARGRLLAVAVTGQGSRRRVVVATREVELRGGRQAQEGERARVYTGALRRTADGWRMVAWEREP